MENALCLLSDVCRLCLHLPGTHNIKTKNLIQDILIFTGVKICSDEALPQNVCSSCLYKIEAIKDLKECATRNDLYMTALINNDDTRHEVSLPKMDTKIMSEIVGECPEMVNRYLLQEKKQRKERINKQNNTEKTEIPKISVKSVNDINTHSLKETECSKISETSVKDMNTQSSKEEIHKKIKKERSTSTSDKNSRANADNEHKCDICNKIYSTWKKLYCHQRSHSKNLFCPLDVCGKSFACKGDLQKHIRAHTGEKPYQCNLCFKSFTQNVTLRSHREAIHGGQ